VRVGGALRFAGVLVVGAAAAARGGEAEWLPEVSVHLKAGRYLPAETAFGWTGWVGAGAGLLKLREATAYFSADIETIIGNELRGFDANQANWHLEAGLKLRAGDAYVVPFFHHVSRHLVDRPKTQAVDWNLLGLRVSAARGGVRAAASLGHTVQRSLVGYGWEARVLAEARAPRRGGGPYLRGELRFVSAGSGTQPPGDGFVDLHGEAGLRGVREGRSFDLFVAWERRNDVFVEQPGARTRALAGFRIGYAPAGPAGPLAPISTSAAR
jgi:hypothetical protein